MRLRLGELRCLVREVSADCWGGSQPEETYDQEVDLDETDHGHSVLVPDDVKAQVGGYLKKMGLAGTKKGRSRSH